MTAARGPPSPRLSRRFRLGGVEVDHVTLREALEAIESLVESGRGGVIVTPNVDHVVLAERSPEFRAAYAAVDLSLADGQPIVWSSRLLGTPLPEKVSGSDLVPPLMALSAKRRWRVFLLGAGPGVAEAAADRLRLQPGVDVVGTSAPLVSVGDRESHVEEETAIEAIRAAAPHIVLVALGAPKQEIWMHRRRGALAPAVLIGVGASLDFIAGRLRRAPAWVSRAGFEWLWRLAHEPRRLGRRYLVDDPAFILVLWREILARYGRSGSDRDGRSYRS